MSDAPARASRIAALALVRKEARVAARSALRLVAGASVVLVAMRLLSSVDEVTSPLRELLPLICVLIAAMLGGESVASESAGRTAAFLAARPISPSRVRAVKLAVHGGAALLASVLLSGLVRLLAGRPECAWLETLDVPASCMGAWPIALAGATFALAFAASTLLHDGLIAALAGLCIAAGWLSGALSVATSWSGSLEAALRMTPLMLALVIGPAALALIAVIRMGPRGAAALMLGACVLPWLPLAVAMPARDLAEIAHRTDDIGRAAEIVEPTGHGVAYVATSRGGTTHAVIADDNATGEPALVRVLPAGTRPIEWAPRGGVVLVEWPEDVMRVVTVEGSTQEPWPNDWPSLRAREARR
jgi:hypothetical protein